MGQSQGRTGGKGAEKDRKPFARAGHHAAFPQLSLASLIALLSATPALPAAANPAPAPGFGLSVEALPCASPTRIEAALAALLASRPDRLPQGASIRVEGNGSGPVTLILGHGARHLEREVDAGAPLCQRLPETLALLIWTLAAQPWSGAGALEPASPPPLGPPDSAAAEIQAPDHERLPATSPGDRSAPSPPPRPPAVEAGPPRPPASTHPPIASANRLSAGLGAAVETALDAAGWGPQLHAWAAYEIHPRLAPMALLSLGWSREASLATSTVSLERLVAGALLRASLLSRPTTRLDLHAGPVLLRLSATATNAAASRPTRARAARWDLGASLGLTASFRISPHLWMATTAGLTLQAHQESFHILSVDRRFVASPASFQLGLGLRWGS